MIKPGHWRRAAWLVFVIAALFLFLGTRGLNEPDEGRYAEIAREMTVTGEWLVPHLNGFEHFQKPPLLYWLTAASIRLLGVNEWAARLPSALAALGVVLLTFGIARRIFDRAAALAAALVLVSSIGFFALARLLTPDMLLTLWVTAAVASLVFRRPWLFFVCMGLGFLTKGPMALVVPISAALGWQLAPRGDGEKLPLPWLRGMALTLTIGLSWFVVLSVRDGALFDYFWRCELVERFASTGHGRSKPFWFFAPVLIVGFLPWIFFLPARARELWTRWRSGAWMNTDGLLCCWIVPPLLILSLSGSKLPTYILPLFPALSLLVARSLRVQALQWRIAIPAACCWVAAAAVLPLFNDRLQQQASVRTLAAVLERQPDAAQARVFACEVRAHGFTFYLRRLVSTTQRQADIVLPTSAPQQARVFESAEALERAFAGHERAYGIVRTERYETTFDSHNWLVLARAGDFLLLSNRAVAPDASGDTVTRPSLPERLPLLSGRDGQPK